jgi:hypothetical protein
LYKAKIKFIPTESSNTPLLFNMEVKLVDKEKEVDLLFSSEIHLHEIVYDGVREFTLNFAHETEIITERKGENPTKLLKAIGQRKKVKKKLSK